MKQQAINWACRRIKHAFTLIELLVAVTIVVPANMGSWWSILSSGLGGQTNDSHRVKLLQCPDFPDKRWVFTYVINAWSFKGPTDPVGELLSCSWRLSRIQRPVDTVYFADAEQALCVQAPSYLVNGPDAQMFDVWKVPHLPYSHLPSGQTVLNPDRRVAAARHRAGANLLFFDTQAAWRKADRILVDDWRAQKRD